MNKLQQERADKGLCILCGAPALPKKGGGYLRLCKYHHEKDVIRKAKSKAERAIVSQPFIRQMERGYTGNVAARYMHRCQECKIAIYNEFYFCPWCGVRQPEV